MTASNGYGRPGSKAARTRQIVHELLLAKYDAGEIPTDNRFCFYELEHQGNARVPEEHDSRPNRRRSHGWPPGAQDVLDAVTWLRDEGIVPWDWIVDETRQLSSWATAPTVADYVRERLAEATIDPWDGEPSPLILTETRGMAGVLTRALSDYTCPIAPVGGQANGFLRTVVAPHMGDGREVLYIGDLDKAGRDIERNAQRVLGDAVECRVAQWRRLAITEAQAEKVKPIWKVDGRGGRGEWAWQAESLGQAANVALVRRALDARLPEPLARVHERERVQIASAEAQLARTEGTTE